ncbi:MAG: AI-2E family transporter [Candidatus Kerfeldbacteria bacterium]|nr:AI-2E family transporter [Candidatus Kerfeldbacteria bacterium]
MAAERRTATLDVTAGSILRFFGLIVVVMALWSIRNVLAIVVFSIIFASAALPLVNWLHRRRVPRALGITLVFLLILGIITVVLVLFGQLVTDQVRQLAADVPALYQRVVDFLFRGSQADAVVAATLQRWLQSISGTLVNITTQLAAGTISLFGGLFSFVGILVLTFYMVLEEDGFKRFVNSIAPVAYLPYLHQLVQRIQARLGGWVRGQLLLSLIIGSLSYIGLLLLGVDYALTLALIAGVTELIPIAGPIIGAIPAVLVAFGQSPLLAGLVLVLYVVIQQLENNLIVPKVMQKTTGLNPIVTIIVVLVAGTLAGLVGVILAIPVALIIDSFFEDFFKEEGATGPGDEPVESDV